MGRHRANAVTDVSIGSSAAEAAVLVALVTAPILLIPFADNPFEPHRAAFLWAAAGAAAGAFVASPRAAWQRIRTLEGWPRAALICAGLAVATTLVSTLMSEAPMLAWWGSVVRRQGALTPIAILGLMMTVLVVSSAESFERLVTAAMIGSIGPTVYALYQVPGVDPLTWDAGLASRASSTFGNPLFFAGYLVTVLPLTLGRAVSGSRRVWALVGLQLAALIATGSRGPALALLAACVLAGILLVASRGHRRAAIVLSGLAVVVSLLFVGAAPARMQRALARVPEGGGSRTSGATATVRLILWEAVGKGLTARPKALPLGAGPESVTGFITRNAGPDLPMLEGPNTSPDRAHNETLETLATFGIAGAFVRLALIGVALGAALNGLGLLEPSQTPGFTILAVSTLVVAAAVAMWSGGGVWAVALAPPAALVMTLAGSVGWRARAGSARDTSATIAIAGATAAWIAHFIEIQLSVDTVASGLTAAVAIAITAGAARGARSGADAAVTARSSATREHRERDGVALLAGWSVAILAIGLAGPQAAPGVSASLIAATALALAIAFTGSDLRRLAVSAGTCLAVTGVWCLWPNAGACPVDRPAWIYVAAAGCLAALTRGLTRRSAAGSRRWRPQAAWAVSAGAVVSLFSMRVSASDVLTRCAARSALARDGRSAALYEEAADRDRSNDRALTRLADLLMAEADAAPDGDSRAALLVRARDALTRARAIDPSEYHHPRNLAALQRRWARRLPPAERAPHLTEADRLYADAADLVPASGVLWAEWGNLDAERGRFSEALAKLDRAAALGAGVEAVSVADAILRAEGRDVGRPGSAAQIAADLTRRGRPALGAVYLRRAIVDAK